MESLIADFIHFLALLSNLYFYQGNWGLDYVCTQFRNFTNVSLFFKSFSNSWDNSYIQFLVIFI